MANTKKITKRDRFNELLNLAEVKANPNLVEFIEHELELLAKKNSADKKPTATQKANEGVKNTILEALSPDVAVTITELQKSNSELAELSNQKISALLKQMVENGSVVREEIKRKAHFKRA